MTCSVPHPGRCREMVAGIELDLPTPREWRLRTFYSSTDESALPLRPPG